MELQMKEELAKRNEELQNKILMIKEIRALQSLREYNIKNKPSETVGSLCGMSTAEV